MCFWCGIIKIVANTSLQDKLKRIIDPINKIIFNRLNPESKVYQLISMNMIANMLGIGNAATPIGIKVIDELEKVNKYENELSDEMILFIAINTASLQIIPTNVIAIRSSLNSDNPTQIIGGVLFSSFLTFVVIILLCKKYIELRKKRLCRKK